MKGFGKNIAKEMFTRQFFRTYTKFIHSHPENYSIIKLQTNTAFVYKNGVEPARMKRFTKCLNFIFNCTNKEQLNIIKKAAVQKLDECEKL